MSTQRKIKKAIMAEVRHLHQLSHSWPGLPVARFIIDCSTGRVVARQFAGQYGVLDELIRLCDELEQR